MSKEKLVYLELQKLMVRMLDHIDKYEDSYKKVEWTNKNIVFAWFTGFEHELKKYHETQIKFIDNNGLYFKSKRKKLMMSLREVEKISGVSKATISRIERGKDVFYSNIIKLFDFYQDSNKCTHCGGDGWGSFPNHQTNNPICEWCEGTGKLITV